MKCIKHIPTGEILRLSNENAEIRVKGEYAYCPKSEWKAQQKKEG